MRYLALAVGLLLVAPPEARAEFRNFRKNGQGQTSAVAFSFLPTNGSGAPVIADLCDAYAGELTGATSFCLRGNGTQSSTATLTAIAAPGTTTKAVCPNGLNCGSVSYQSLNGSTQYFENAAAAAPSGDFSGCALYERNIAGAVDLIGKDDGGSLGTGRSFVMFDTGGSISFYLFKADGSFSNIGSAGNATITLGRHLVCFTYDFVTDGTSVAKIYVDGVVSGTPSSVFVGPVQGAATIKTRVGNRVGSANIFSGLIGSSLLTEKVLSASTIAAMARTVLADAPVGTHGEALTLARSSVKLCDPGSGGIVSTLPPARPCVAPGGLDIEGAATNLVLRSRDLSHAAWTKSSATCTLTATGVDGAPSAASTCTASGANGTVLQNFTVSAATRATAFDIRRRTGTGEVDVTRDNGSTWTAVVLTSSFQRFTPLTTAALSSGGANPTVGIRITTNGDAVDVDFVQDEAGAYSSSRIATAGTSVTRAADIATFPSPSSVGINTTEGCSLLTFVPAWSGSPGATEFLIGLNSSTNARVPYLQSGAGDIRAYAGASIATEGVTYVAGTTYTARTSWSAAANVLRVSMGGSPTTQAFSALGTINELEVGNVSGAGSQPIRFSGIVLGKTSIACGSTP